MAPGSLVDRLAELVSFDTQNPDGEERPLVHRLARELAALGARAGRGGGRRRPRLRLRALRRASRRALLLNAHVDTVPANSGYTSPPHLLVRRGDRLHGLGTADTKGAIAAMLEALAARAESAPVGVLFSGDEEHGGGCIRAFLDSEAARGLEQAIVCEPTGCRVGVRHRGIGAATVTLEGPGGHSSRVDEPRQPDRGAGARGGRARRHGARAPGQGAGRVPGDLPQRRRRSTAASPSTSSRRARRCRSRCGPRRATSVDDLLAEAERRVRAADGPARDRLDAWSRRARRSRPRDLAGVRAAAGRARARTPSTSGSGPRRRACPSAASTRWCSAPATSSRRTPPTSSSTIAELEAARAAFAHGARADGSRDRPALPGERRRQGRHRSLPEAVPRAAQGELRHPRAQRADREERARSGALRSAHPRRARPAAGRAARPARAQGRRRAGDARVRLAAGGRRPAARSFARRRRRGAIGADDRRRDPRRSSRAARSRWSRWRPRGADHRRRASGCWRRWPRALETRKVVFLSRRPGLAAGAGPSRRRWSAWRPIRAAAGARRRCRAGRRCCSARSSGSSRRCPHRFSVTVVNPLQLLRELFTVNGAGTLIRRGSRIDVRTTAGTASIASRLRGAVRLGVRAARSAPTSSRSPIARIYVEENYRGRGRRAETARSRPT